MSNPLKNATLCRVLINLQHTLYSNLARRDLILPLLTRRNRKATSSLLPGGVPGFSGKARSAAPICRLAYAVPAQGLKQSALHCDHYSA
jgi:hypothetical protein